VSSGLQDENIVAEVSLASSEDKEILNFLSKVALFQRLPVDQHAILSTAFERTEFSRGTSFINEGEEGNEFFVITKGQVGVIVDGKRVAGLSKGDYLGENALLRNEPRNATITAETHVNTLKLTREKFWALGLNEKLEFAKRQAVGGGGGRNHIVKPPSAKTPEDRKLMMNALKANTNLNMMVSMNEAMMNALIDVAWEDVAKSGTELISQGSTEADYFYIVKEGSFEITIAKEAGVVQSADKAAACTSESVGSVGPGGSFGELALHYFTPRKATVKATAQSVVWVIDRQNFKSILANAEDKSAEYVKYLEKNEFFNNLRPDELQEVAQNLLESNFSKGETIFEQGEAGNAFYILYDGEVSVIKDSKEVARPKATPSVVTVFGEMALINSAPRAATVKVVSDTAKTLYMDKLSFDMLLGPLEDIKSRGSGGESKVGKGLGTPAKQERKSQKELIYRKDLVRLGLLGCGGFGCVELVEHKPTNDTYALKALSKGHVVKCGMKKGVMSEKNIQMMCDSDFIIKLYETYTGEQSLYFLLELSLGGELYATYARKGLHGSEEHAKFYVAGTVYAFEHLHERKIIFRDLKPENLLITDKGHVKLTDMGLAKVAVGKTYTTCGTPDYFAPELIASIGHTHSVDWWALGILLFELMAGHPPFESPAPMQTYNKVTKGINRVVFPSKLRGNGEDLVKGLCRKDPSQRLPMQKGGIENLRQHAWYKGFDWIAMKDLTLKAPYKPVVKGKKDIANFSVNNGDMPPQIAYTDDGSGWDADFATSE